MSDRPATREEFDAAVSAAPPGLSKEQFHAFIDEEVQRRRPKPYEPQPYTPPVQRGPERVSNAEIFRLGSSARPRTQPGNDGSQPSPVRQGLEHAAHPTSTGDFLGLVAPQTGAELWTPGVRMAKTAIRFAAAEPKTAGVTGQVTGAVRGALRGAWREASKRGGAIQESPRLVKAGTDTPVNLPVGRTRVARPGTAAEAGAFRENVEAELTKALEKTPGAREALPSLDKAIETAKKEAGDVRAASGRREDRMIRAENTADTQEATRLARQDRYNRSAMTGARSDAEAQRLKDLRAANSAQFKYDESVAAKKAADARAANALHFKATEATATQAAKDLRAANAAQSRHVEGVTQEAEKLRQEGLATADRAVEDATKAGLRGDQATEKLRQEGLATADRAVEDATQVRLKADQAAERLRQEGLGVADKAVADAAKTVDTLQDQFGTGTSQRAIRFTAEQAKDARAANAAQYRHETGVEAQAAKAAEEAAKAERIESARLGFERQPPSFSESVSAPAPGGGRQTMSTRFKEPEINLDELSAMEDKLGFGASPAAKVAPYSHHSTDLQPRFKIEGSDVTAAEAASRGYTAGEIPAGAGAATSTAGRDAALARQAARQATRTTPVTKQTDVPLRSGQELSTEGSIKYQTQQFDKNHPDTVEMFGDATRTDEEMAALGRTRAPAPERRPWQSGGSASTATPAPAVVRQAPPVPAARTDVLPADEAALRSALGSPGRVLKISPETQAKFDAFTADRAARGAVPAARAAGITPMEARLLDRGQAGTLPTNATRDIDTRIRDIYGSSPTKAQLTEYATRTRGNHAPGLANYLQSLIDLAQE
jgi:hypothetical protein